MKRLLRPALDMPRLGLPAFRLRILVRSVFVLLALATLALSVVLLKEEKERAWQSYQRGFERSQSEVMARLRHPSGQLALLNAAYRSQGATPLAPLLLPYSAIDFDDQNKAQQAVEMAGCSVQYPNGASVCAAIGNNPYAGGFIYLVGSFYAGELIARERGVLALDSVHRARISLDMRGSSSRWVAPFEDLAPQGTVSTRGRLTGFVDNGTDTLDARARPVRDFRGWLWQNGQCRNGAAAETSPDCLRRTYYSVRLPVELFREALFRQNTPLVWPPEDLGAMRVRVEMLAPGDSSPVLFDSNAPDAKLAASLDEVSRTLLPGEKVQIRKIDTHGAETLVLKGLEVHDEPSAPWLIRLISWLPLDAGTRTAAAAADAPEGRDVLDTPTGNYAVAFTGDLRGVEHALAVVATRMSWYLGAMLAAIAWAWLVVEVGLIRRITALTRRAAAVSYNVQPGHTGPRLGDLDVSDLRGSDELGILAAGLADLLERVKDDLQREQLRAQQERDMWHAVGHEIMSPLQSLMVLHAGPQDPSHRYVRRMQQAVHVLMARHHRRRPCKPPMCRRGNSIWMRSCTTWPIAPTSRACSTWHTTPARAIGPVIVRDRRVCPRRRGHPYFEQCRPLPPRRQLHHADTHHLGIHRQRHTAQLRRHHCRRAAGANFRPRCVRPSAAPVAWRRGTPGTGAVRGKNLYGQDGGHHQCAQRGRRRGLHPHLSALGLKGP